MPLCRIVARVSDANAKRRQQKKGPGEEISLHALDLASGPYRGDSRASRPLRDCWAWGGGRMRARRRVARDPGPLAQVAVAVAAEFVIHC